MTNDDASDQLASLRRLARTIAKADEQQRLRLQRRFDLAVEARDAGATWAAINQAAGVANMQATINAGRR